MTRVERTARLFQELGATIDLSIYPGIGHTLNQDEIEAIRHLLDGVV